ncbi:hypothetical protein AVEN_88451-1 [Araneus ventricosus]|uniref:Uncharacterized protein n=1 Tax=Araneus ventricosus TaxID=182803 RepID=A0A4Y2JJ28_ARAVE|nr:hypothetical protein AVEN_88451-1 [Araneus ventricosus]
MTFCNKMVHHHIGIPSFVVFLHAHFTGRWIGLGGPISWPPRSPDITELNIFLWGFVKDIVYRRKVSNINDLKARITTRIAAVDADMLARTWHEI